MPTMQVAHLGGSVHDGAGDAGFLGGGSGVQSWIKTAGQAQI